jgi:hypothetical protein
MSHATATRTGSSNVPSKQDLINFACTLLHSSEIHMGRRKVFSLVDRFVERAPKADGWMFFQFLASAISLSVEQRNAAIVNQDLMRIIDYLDPTGETAVNNVIRQRGF